MYRMTTTIYQIALFVSALEIPTSIIKYVAELKDNTEKLNQIVSVGVSLSLFLGLGFSILFFFTRNAFAALFAMPGLSHLIKILSPVFPFALFVGSLLGLLNGLREMKQYAKATLLQSGVMITCTAGLIYYGFGVASAVIGIVASSVITSFFLIWIGKTYYQLKLQQYAQTTRKLLGFSSKVFGTNMINMINYRADILLVGYFLSADKVGYYAAAVGFSGFLLIIPSAIQKITFPATSEYWAHQNYRALEKMINKSMKYAACILLPIGLSVGFFAEKIIPLIFRQDFVSAVWPLQVLIIGTLFLSIVKAIGGSLTGAGRPDLPFKIALTSATINILLNLLLIPHLGITGAAVATTISLSINSYLTIYFIRVVLKIDIEKKWFLKVFGLTLLSVTLFILCGFGGPGIKALGGMIILCLYTFIIFAFFLTKEDRDYLKKISFW